MTKASVRLWFLALIYGAVAGVAALLTFQAMTGLQHLIWAGESGPLRIVVTILVGGAILLGLTWIVPSQSVEELLAGDAETSTVRFRLLITAAAAVTAVAFGGAVGPEAGLLAVVAQLSAIVSARIARDQDEAQALEQAGRAAALGGLYGSPPAAAAMEGDELGSAKLLSLVAAIAGFAAFVGAGRWFSEGGTFAVALPQGGAPGAAPLLGAVVVALVGGLLGWGYLWLRDATARFASARGRRAALILGTCLFALLAAAVPLVRFSGHHEIDALGPLLAAGAGGSLALVAGAKLVALAICLASGWRGGEIFPLVFVGAAVGACVATLAPLAPPAELMVAGMAAVAAIGWGRPIATMLLLVLAVPGLAWLPLLVGVGVAVVIARLLPVPEASGHGH